MSDIELAQGFVPLSDFQVTPILGYILYCEKYDVVYKSRIYGSEPAALKALAGVVWHNRSDYAIRQVTIIGWKNVP